MKRYSELSMIEKSVIKDEIQEMRLKGMSFRDISKKINTYVKITHTTVSNIWKNDIGASLDTDTTRNEDEHTDNEVPKFDFEYCNQLKERHSLPKDLINMIYTLCIENVKDHIRTGARLKTSYLKYLKDIKSII